MLPRRLQAVVFDMDGLLVDTEAVARETFLLASAEHGHDLPEEVYLRLIGLPGAASREILHDHVGPDVDLQAFWKGWEAHYEARLELGVALKAGVLEILDLLDAVGLPRAIATSSSHRHVDQHLLHHRLASRFTAVAARGDYARGKPHPDPFLKAAEMMQADPAHCLALEDSHNGVRAAHAAGMMTVMVPDLLAPTGEIEALCVSIAESLHEVRDLIAAMAGRPAEETS